MDETRPALSQGTYVSVIFSKATQLAIQNFLTRHGIAQPVIGDDLHTTIIYSRKLIDWSLASNINKSIELDNAHFEVWKNYGEETYCLVLAYQSEWLQNRFRLARELGATWDFPDYHPHVTLSYQVPENFDITQLEIPDFRLQLEKETLEILTFKQ